MQKCQVESDLTFSLREVARAASVEEQILRDFIKNDVIKPFVRGGPGVSHRFSAGQLYGIAHAIAWYAHPSSRRWSEVARMVKHYEEFGETNILTLCGLSPDDLRAAENLAAAIPGKMDDEAITEVTKAIEFIDNWEQRGCPQLADPPWLKELMAAISYAHESACKAIRKKVKLKTLEHNRLKNFKAKP